MTNPHHHCNELLFTKDAYNPMSELARFSTFHSPGGGSGVMTTGLRRSP